MSKVYHAREVVHVTCESGDYMNALEYATQALADMPLLPCTDTETQLRVLLRHREEERRLIREQAGELPHYHEWEYDIYGEIDVAHTHPFEDVGHGHPIEEKPERPDGSHPWDY